jgi:N-methylhydantoinase B/oxoprolinase/acetone carboxylase alpha subunit
LTYRALGKALTNVNCERTKDPPWGLNGGKPGAVNEALLVRRDGAEQKLLKATSVPMELDDRLVFRTAGGGGWGAPGLRDRRAIEDDVAKGYVSMEAARRDYGYDGQERLPRRRTSPPAARRHGGGRHRRDRGVRQWLAGRLPALRDGFRHS